MTRDKRPAAQQSPSFVWEGLDSRSPNPGAASGSAGVLVTAEVEATEHEDRREPGARRGSTGRALIAAAVLVPLAGGAYAVLDHSTRHDETTVFTGGAAPATSVLGSAGSDSAGGQGSGSTAKPGSASGSGSSTGSASGSGSGSGSKSGTGGPVVGQSSNPGLGTGLPPSSNTGTTPAGGLTQAPANSTTSAADPGQTAANPPTTSKPTATSKPTQPPKPPATSSKPTPSKSPTSNKPKCATAWSPNISYVPNQVVSYEGDNYTAIYYSTDAAPNAAISWDVWTSDGACA